MCVSLDALNNVYLMGGLFCASNCTSTLLENAKCHIYSRKMCELHAIKAILKIQVLID